jgi:hypothetical protein
LEVTIFQSARDAIPVRHGVFEKTFGVHNKRKVKRCQTPYYLIHPNLQVGVTARTSKARTISMVFPEGHSKPYRQMARVSQ